MVAADHGSDHGMDHRSNHISDHRSDHGLDHGMDHGSDHRSDRGKTSKFKIQNAKFCWTNYTRVTTEQNVLF